MNDDSRVTTHWPDCWRDPKHHACAVSKIERSETADGGVTDAMVQAGLDTFGMPPSFAAMQKAITAALLAAPGGQDFRALVERVCDPKFEGCSEFTLKLDERARIRTALLAGMDGAAAP